MGSEGASRRRGWHTWRLLGGARVPPDLRTLRHSDGIDEASLGGGPGEPGGGADIARDFGDLGDPFADDRPEDESDRRP
jgi:hypothetical protein